MKSLFDRLIYLNKNRQGRINWAAILRFSLVIGVIITVYSVLFHYIMAYEGREESWVTGFYWTLTVMSTLGFGDITFQSDLGKVFSIIVLLSGIIFLLVLLPSTFIEFFYQPWMKAQLAARAPTRLPEKTKGHIILTHYDPVVKSLIEKLVHYQYDYVLLQPDITEALKLHDRGYKVMVGDIDTPKTYELAQVSQALMVVTTANDQVNANVASTVREISSTVPIVATADVAASVDILQLVGCNHVLQLGEMMARALSRRVVGSDTLAHPIGHFGDLIIAEAVVRDTHLVGKTLKDSRLRENIGLNVLGMWERGAFHMAHPDCVINPNMVLVMAGTEAHIAEYNKQFHQHNPSDAPVLILGGGRVGKSTGKALLRRGLDYRIVEKTAARICSEKHIMGDAAELEVLERAGINETPTVIVTTHDDDMNIYLTIYCRKLRPDAQVISRAGLDRNVATLHRAGADFVLSYASTGANAIINLIGRDNILMIAEGLDIFEVKIPTTLRGKSIVESNIRQKSGCTVVAIHDGDLIETMPDPNTPLPADAKIILIGTPEAEEQFLRTYK
jgi:voltage-gated potassium channel